MKVGSLVECVDNNGFDNMLIPLKTNTAYTIRVIRESPFGSGVTQCLLFEVKNGTDKGHEYGYGLFRFREIQFPDNLESEIKEALTRELVTI